MMSFNFDSTPSEDDASIDIDAFDDTGLLALSSRQSAADFDHPIPQAAASLPAAPDTHDGQVGSEESDVDWEDADENDFDESSYKEDDLDTKLPSLPTQGVTITFSSASNTPAEENTGKDHGQQEADANEITPKKRKRKTVRVLKNVPHHTQQLILKVRRSHLMCCLAHSSRCSSLCSVRTAQNSQSFVHNNQEEANLLLNTAYSLIPLEFHFNEKQTPKDIATNYTIPTNEVLHNFSKWFFQFVNAGERRRDAIRRNAAQGARSGRKRLRNSTAVAHTPVKSVKKQKSSDGNEHGFETPIELAQDNGLSINGLITRLMYLSPYYDDDPQLFLDDGIDVIQLAESITPLEKVLLFLAMVRSLGWRARFVSAFNPLPLQLTVDHPMLDLDQSGSKAMNSSWFQLASIIRQLIGLMKEGGVLEDDNGNKKSNNVQKRRSSTKRHRDDNNEIKGMQSSTGSEDSLYWVEVLCSDPNQKQTKSPSTKTNKGKDSVQTAKWVAIFPEQQGYDVPLDAEVFLAKIEENASENNPASKSAKQSSKYSKANKQSPKATKRKPVSYVVATEHFQSSNTFMRFTDVTPRYASSWSQTLRLRGATGKELTKNGGKCVDLWWAESLKDINQRHRCKSKETSNTQTNVNVDTKPTTKETPPVTKSTTINGKQVEILEIASSEDNDSEESDHDEIENEETKELTNTISKEPLPTSKAAFKQHPQYVIASVLNSMEVLHPNARRHICGVFKGEMVYRRRDVSKARTAKTWLYQGRKVKDSEIEQPIKKVKARKKRSSQSFQALASYVDKDETLPTKYADEEGEEMDNLYGIWQTKPWSPPPVGPSDAIPVNEYRNVELALINPGLTHMEQPRLSVVAKKLGIPYAPCMCGYEGHKGNRTPTVRGIVVHDHNVELLNEAYLEYQSQLVESEVEAKRQDVLKKWKRLVVGLLTKDRLDRQYG